MKTLIITLLFFLPTVLSAQDIAANSPIRPASNASADTASAKTESFNGKKALIILDGKEISRDEYKSTNLEECESMMNLKPELGVKRYGQKAKYGTIIITTKSTGKKLEENDPDADGSIFSIAEVMPDYSGGINTARAWVNNNLVYPRSAQSKGIEGKVYISFVINNKGIMEDVKLAMQGPDIDLEKEVLRVVSQIPQFWKPGMNRGNAVNVSLVLPVVFSSKY